MKKLAVTVHTVERWKIDSYKAMNTSNDHNLRCIEVFVVHQVQGQVDLCRNYNSAFVLGSKNLRVSTVEDHSLSYMYKWAMMLFNKSQGREIRVFSYCTGTELSR